MSDMQRFELSTTYLTRMDNFEHNYYVCVGQRVVTENRTRGGWTFMGYRTQSGAEAGAERARREIPEARVVARVK